MTRLSLRAHAKINLNLKILGRRADGYHDLDSLVQTIALHDRLIVEAAPSGLSLEVDDPTIPAGEENLVLRAAGALAARIGRARGARFLLRKSIPAGAGLGGGSSDAAAALAGLDRLWDLGLGRSGLEEVAASIGSDVPFFLHGGTARLLGRGDRVEELEDTGGYCLALVLPARRLATREVYGRLRAPLTPVGETSSIARFGPAPQRGVEDWVRAGNDLEPAARGLCPEIGEIEQRLLGAGALAAAMTGSGSAVFGVYPDRRAAERAARIFRERGPGVFVTEPIGRTVHLAALGLA
jgi:4-diphosphocytidyl-2-C-methyl-D-erythritol kinase